MVPLASLPSSDTIEYLTASLSLKDAVVSKLKAHNIDGSFLARERAFGSLIQTLSRDPISIPLGIASNIDQWVRDSIIGHIKYEVKKTTPQETTTNLVECKKCARLLGYYSKTPPSQLDLSVLCVFCHSLKDY